MRATALILALATSSASCTFAVNHPAATAAIVGGTIGLATCELGTDFDEHGACALVGGGAAALLGGVVLLAILLGGEGNTVLHVPVRETGAEPVRELPTIEDPVPARPPSPPPPPPPPPPVEAAPASSMP